MIRVFAFVGAVTVLLLACGDDDGPASEVPSASSSTPATTSPSVSSTTSAAPDVPDPVVVAVDASSFRNINDMTPVRGFFVDNLLGDLDATVAVAESPDGGTYPVGSVVQLFPGEAMVKREEGFSPTTNDWEFFELIPSATGTEIRVRGGDEVVNMFGGSCATCHQLAEPQWDLICEQDHGCEPLPVDRVTIELFQAGDPRPRVD